MGPARADAGFKRHPEEFPVPDPKDASTPDAWVKRNPALAWEQNGARLQADHGFPLRILIPGFIGGRMVKWLKEIKISPEQSDNHYHFKDNRVLPVNVTPEQAEAEGWWFKPDYIINELNINSAMFHPGHGEVLDLATAGPTYDVEGYAYGGGGRKIIRVEVTLDGGASWFLVKDGDVTHPPNTPNKAGKYWGWCFWKITPSNLTWNVMGMLNNPWFTVVKHFDAGPRHAGPRHGRALGNTYTLADVAKHDTPQDCWIAVNGVVYDTNPYLAEHPGGASSITMNAGTDATDEFTAIHSRKAWTLLDKYAIGTLAADGGGAAARDARADAKGRPVALNPKKRVKLARAARRRQSVARDTPATADEVTGRVDFVIKAYRPLPPRPDGGALSQHLCDRIAARKSSSAGPWARSSTSAAAPSRSTTTGVKKRIAVKRAGLIAGGTGLTPMLQLITAGR
ncbi:hypothetical protein JL720_5948 [Aureococcus anophagefferens]|nr:hypothetical protein JL720_5948 [Aureococcus anophagefferens]